MRKAPADIAGLARFILSSECKSIAILNGGGISVASGIPDFRSPGGMYQTLRPELITATEAQRHAMRIDPTNVVAWDMFRVNQFPYLEVRRPFILGTQQRQWKATIAHRLAELLHVKTSKLTRVYTQNIDGLDQQCDQIPAEKMVYVHGTISQVACEGCGHVANFDEFCQHVRTNIKDIYQTAPSPPAMEELKHNHESTSQASPPPAPTSSTNILCGNCGKPLVKPATVLFGRSLPLEFFERAQEDIPNLDLLLIMGTSLVVSPANSLASNVPASTIRVVINVEPVGDFLGIDYSDRNPNKRDLFLPGTTDQVCLQLIQELGWLEDLKRKSDDLPPSSLQLLQQLDDTL
jgi:NAD-dependent SIR2 family protein deacetylase